MFMPGSPFFLGNRVGSVYVPGDTAVAVEELPAERLDPQRRDEIAAATASYGWRLSFEDEPDGSVSAYVHDAETSEVLKAAVGTDFEDVWLRLGIELRPPSHELRRHSNRT